MGVPQFRGLHVPVVGLRALIIISLWWDCKECLLFGLRTLGGAGVDREVCPWVVRRSWK